MAALGYVSVSSQYRLSAEAKWPAQIDDVRTALRWVHANAADLGVDESKVVAFGYSAGGQLALIAAGTQGSSGENGRDGTRTPPIAAVVALYPPTTMSRLPDGGVPEPMRADAPESEYTAASPMNYARAGFPPTILLHGTPDTTVAFENSLHMFQALRVVGVPVELHAFPGLLHAFDGYADLAPVCATMIDLFLDRHVVNPREHPAQARQAPARP
jgi:acetyl esterase/lipase